jgi:penicillin amidase
VGETEAATFFGYGYAQAQDHLEDMMIHYMDAQGRRAEVVGIQALGDGYLSFIPYEYRWDGDYLQRLLRTKQVVIERKEEIDPQVYTVLDGFARGVNQFIRDNRENIPEWIEPITAEDVEAQERCHYFRFYSIHDAVSKIEDRPFTFPRLGSNHFAISKEKSAEGRVVHVEHTHMPWNNRFQNYEAHLITPGKLYAAGISWFGSPFFLDGFNDKITWSATYNGPNIADVYEERLNPENHQQYLYEGQWREIEVVYESFRVKSQEGLSSVTLPLYYTHHGPVVKIDQRRHRAYSVKLPNFEGVGYSENYYRMMKAQNLEEFQAVLKDLLMPRWNMLFSDAENIYYIHNGVVPKRPEGFDWRKPVPGWTKETEWDSYLPMESHPQVLNPPAGFLQNCNSAPWVSTKDSGLNPHDPTSYYLRSKPGPDAGPKDLNRRSERIFRVMDENETLTIEQMKELAWDTYILHAEVIVPLLIKAYERKKRQIQDERVATAIEHLKGWDYRSSKESIAYSYMHYWGKIYKERFGGEFSKFGALTRYEIDLDSPEEQEKALTALQGAIENLEEKFGKAEVPWGEINIVIRGGRFPIGGNWGYENLHPDYGPEMENGEIHCDDGWGHVLVVVEGERKSIWSLLPYGQSQDPSSPHYNDQLKMHSERMLKKFWFYPEEILEHTQSVWGDESRLTSDSYR